MVHHICATFDASMRVDDLGHAPLWAIIAHIELQITRDL